MNETVMKNLFKLFWLSLVLLSACKETQTAQLDELDYTKPHAPVEMTFTLSAKPQVGHDLTVELVLSTTTDAEDLVVSVTADNNLTLLEYPSLQHLGAQRKQQQQAIKISCQPQQDGLFYLNVSATLVYDGQQQSRSFAIPVNVGDVDISRQLKATGVVEQDASGEAIISMPAQQSIRPAK
jgi:hypothetical protein